jgi:XTP/dITP diphosphohydrolase
MAAGASAGVRIQLGLLPGFRDLPEFEESAPTFAENAVGKALHYSRFSENPVIADDSGLVVEALGGRPGVHSARYAGPGATDADRIAKLLGELRNAAAAGAVAKGGVSREARFVCVVALAVQGHAKAVLSESVSGEILDARRGSGGFGYDSVFLLPALGKSFAEMDSDEKNLHSHRGKACRKLLQFVATSAML